MQRPEILGLRDLLTTDVETEWTLADGRKWWGPARPIGFARTSLFGRFRAAWLVFTGKADALRWPE